jgi:hypothetical protein
MPVSPPFITPSMHEPHVPPLSQRIDAQSVVPAQCLPSGQAWQFGPPQSTSVSPWFLI